MVTVQIEPTELEDIKLIAQKRHNAKDKSFRNTGILIPDPASVYAPHTIGLVGEFAWGKHTNQTIDEKIYDVRDDGQDFHNTEVKTITYFGAGEPELKIKQQEFASKTPALYVLTRVDKNDLTKVDLLGTISREQFDKKKESKQYGPHNPLNYIVKLSDMDEITQADFLSRFSAYDDCIPPGVLLPEIKVDPKYYKSLGIDSNISNLEFLHELCNRGIEKYNINELSNKKTYHTRVEMELRTLHDLGFVDYVLLNWDVLNYCHEDNIPTGPGRGSAAGSLVLFLIGVTEVDPVKHDLFFERFVSKSRARKIEKEGVVYLDGSLLADIDNDIAYEHRQRVIHYIESRHPDRTAKILTLNTLSGKLCIKECGKIVAGNEESEVNVVSDMIPKAFGAVMNLSRAYEESEKFAQWADENSSIYKIALQLEGLNKNTGVHPSGIAISRDRIQDICPLQLTGEGALVTGYDMNWVSELMVKFDILGLRTLSVIYDVCNEIGINVNDIDLESTAVFSPLENLRTPHGLFQIEADTNFKVCKKVKPKNLEELSAVVALARPGALEFVDAYASYSERGESQIVHEFFEDVLHCTGGIPLYQEQLMQMAVKVGFSLDEAEQLRRIVGKKKVKEMPMWKGKIEKRVADSGLDPQIGEILWVVAQDSANYSFNKSHSLSYATLAAWTVYLKFSHPQHFFLSLLRMTKFEPAPHEEITKISQELGHFGINLLSPDLVKSEMDFSIEGQDIRFGLNSIKGVSAKSLQALRDFRESDTPTKFDIFLEAKQAGLNIGIVSALIQAGALSTYKSNRSLLALEAQAFNILTDREKRNVLELGEKHDYKLLNILADARDGKLLGDDGRPLMPEKRFETFRKKYQPYKDIYEKNKKYEKFANWYFETKLLGYSYTTNLKDVFRSDRLLLSSTDAQMVPRNTEIKFIGTVADCFKRTSKNGNEYLKILMNDEVGSVEGLFINSRQRQGRSWVQNDRLDRYLAQGNPLPTKGNIAMVRCTRGEDVFFIEDLQVLDQKIYMKLSDLK
jgi:DNA-directed DNA polymerase III PolC